MSWGGYIPGDMAADVLASVGDPREERLPKWAQGELADLRRKLREAKATIRELREDIPDSDTFVEGRVYGEDPDRPLPRGARLAFMLGDKPGRGSVRAYVARESWAGTRLYLNGDRVLRIDPQSGNALYVSLGD